MNSQTRQSLLHAFRAAQLTEKEASSFCELWKEKSFDKGEFITEAGQIERYFYFVVNGVQTGYLLNRKGDKVVFGFAFDGSFSGIFDSFLQQQPSAYFFEVLTPSTLLYITYEEYQQLFDTYPGFDRWGRLWIQQILLGRLKREKEMQMLSAKERYTAFMRRIPPLLQQIPQKYLASYLGMTPETFSRLRSKVKY